MCSFIFFLYFFFLRSISRSTLRCVLSVLTSILSSRSRSPAAAAARAKKKRRQRSKKAGSGLDGEDADGADADGPDADSSPNPNETASDAASDLAWGSDGAPTERGLAEAKAAEDEMLLALDRGRAATIPGHLAAVIVMGLTGLLLVGFLAEHLYGNLKLVPVFGDDQGVKFEEYRDGLHSFGIWLKFAEVGLVALFLCHAYLGIRLSLENREARKQRYVIRSDRGAQTFGSASMFVTGALVLGYLIKHILERYGILMTKKNAQAGVERIREGFAG